MGIGNPNLCFKRQMRYAFLIEGISMFGGLNALVCHKAQRPNLSFKEMNFEHLTETIYMPGKPEWKPVQITLYDTWNPAKGIDKSNPVYTWIRSFYWGDTGTFGFAAQNANPGADQFKKTAYLNMYDGAGCLVEAWQFDNAWPQDINFNEVDYSSNDVMSIDITLRYDRAYIIN